jgi:hypothetical protein
MNVISESFASLRMNSTKNPNAGDINTLRDSSSRSAPQNDIFGDFFSSLLTGWPEIVPDFVNEIEGGSGHLVRFIKNRVICNKNDFDRQGKKIQPYYLADNCSLVLCFEKGYTPAPINEILFTIRAGTFLPS